MRDLLKSNEVRRIVLIEELNKRKNWTTLTELSKKLDYSESTLKEDIAYFRREYDSFQIESSYEGIRIIFKQNTGLKSFYQRILEESLAFNIIESIIYVETGSEEDLVNQFFISKSTLYRQIKEINIVLKREFDIEIATNPLIFTGSEEKIRSFFYNYFNERYSEPIWAFPSIDEEAFDQLLQVFLDLAGIQLDFSEYMNFKLITLVNFLRYKNNHFVHINPLETNFTDILDNLSKRSDWFATFEEALGIKIDKEAVMQIFCNYVNACHSTTYEELVQKAETHGEMKEAIAFLSNLIDQLAADFALPILNKEEILLKVTNIAYNELSKPQSQPILYNRMSYSVNRFTENFPQFSKVAMNGLKQYRDLIQIPQTSNTMQNIMVKFMFSWKNVIFELQNKWPKTSILVLSDINTGHANTIKDILRFSFGNTVKIDVQENLEISEEDYDVVVANYPKPALEGVEVIYIENIPTVQNLSTITRMINQLNVLNDSRNYYTNQH